MSQTALRVRTEDGHALTFINPLGEEIETACDLGVIPTTNICGDCYSMTKEDECPQCGASMKQRGILSPDPQFVEFISLEQLIEEQMDHRKLSCGGGDTDGDIVLIDTDWYPKH